MEFKWIAATKQTDRKQKIDLDALGINAQFEIAPEELVINKPIGAGFYGQVLSGEWKGAKVAIKQCNNDVDTSCFVSHAKATMEAMPHPNLVQVMGVSVSGSTLSIVLEYCSKGSLKGKTLSKEQQREYALKIATAVESLHNQDIIHGNLSARNILFTYDNEPKVSDYGRASVVQQILKSKKPVYEAMKWMAPESLKDKTFTKESDVWSYGILLYELTTGKEPHVDADQLTVAVKIRDEGLTPVIPSDCDPVVKKVMDMCWKVNPNERPTMEQIVNMFEVTNEM